jgi:hypothetical protein
MINRTSFLLNYLSDVVDGAKSYSEWMNGDLYERTTEQFGICKFPGEYLSETYHKHPQVQTNNRIPANKISYGDLQHKPSNSTPMMIGYANVKALPFLPSPLQLLKLESIFS